MSDTLWGSQIIFEVSSAAPDAEEPVWVDLSSRLLDVGQGLNIAEGRQTELADVEPGAFAVQLSNRDDALTPGNPLSPYVSWWKQGRRCRLREIVGWLAFDLFDGYLEIPETTVRTQVTTDTDSDVTMTITGVDLMGKHSNSRPFVSTLGEHIIYHGGSALVAFWPMGDSDGPDVDAAVGGPWTLSQTRRLMGAGSAPANDAAAITFGGPAIAPGDDMGSVVFDPYHAADTFIEKSAAIALFGARPTPLTLSAGQVATIVCWIRPSEVLDSSHDGMVVILKSSSDETISARIEMYGDTLVGSGGGDGWTGAVFGPPVPKDQPIPIAVRVGFDPAVMELWVRGETYTSAMSVTTPNATVFDQIEIGGSVEIHEGYPGAINNVQIYVGAESDWTHDDFLAQREAGLYGLERQGTGERINTIADYAGIPTAQRDIDPGCSVMSPARLAGKTAAQAWDEARDTEQGRLFAHAGRLVFHDRARIYNV